MKNHWLNKSEYPFASKYISINGHRLHYIDEGEGDVLLFVHGTPSWSFDFRNVIKQLRGSYRCVAIDHIGFGLSDKPEHYDYSTINHSRTLEQFIRLQNLESITLVLHDFGGPIGLNYAINHAGNVRGLVVLNSWLWSAEGEPDFVRMKKILQSPLLPFLYRYLNFSPRFILPKSYGDSKLSAEMLKQYTSPFADRTQRNGALAFATSLLQDQQWFEQLWNKRDGVSTKPTLFVWGMKDPVIPPKYLDKFVSGFQNSTVCKIHSAGHFPQEEQPQKVAESIAEFMATFQTNK